MTIEELLAAWRVDRSASLSEAISVLSAAEDAQRPRLVPGKTVADRVERWNASDVSEQMRTLCDVPAKYVEQRLEALLTYEPDPRIALGVLSAMDTAFVVGGVLWSYFRELNRIIVVHGDARALAILEERSPGPTRAGPLSRTNVLSKTALELRATLRALEEVDPAGSATKLKIARESAPKIEPLVHEPALLQAIYDDPNDSSARQVYADYLLDRGDPRGEFINLQMRRGIAEHVSAAAAKRENELIRTYVDEWLGPIANVVLKDGREFERGFLHACRVKQKGDVKRAIGAHEWSTVVELDIEAWSSTPEIATQDALRSLRTLRGVNPTWMGIVPISVERVELTRNSEWFLRYGVQNLIGHAPKCIWRGVQHLDVSAISVERGVLDPFFDCDFVRSLQSLTLALYHPIQIANLQLGQQLVIAARCSVPIVRAMRFPERENDWRYELVREPFGKRLVRCEPRGVPQMADLASILEAFPVAQISRVEVVGVTDDELAQLRIPWPSSRV